MTPDPVLAFDPIRILRQRCLASPEEGATTGYEALASNAEPVSIAGATILVCGLEDLIRMKQAAGRPKDLIEVEVLKAVLQASRTHSSNE